MKTPNWMLAGWAMAWVWPEWGADQTAAPAAAKPSLIVTTALPIAIGWCRADISFRAPMAHPARLAKIGPTTHQVI